MNSRAEVVARVELARAWHPWNLTAREAIVLQEQLAGRVERIDRLQTVRRVAGVDVGFERRGKLARGAVAVLDATTLRPMQSVVARAETAFPYVPGLLSFREIPVILDAIARLDEFPELIICDGQGLAHPRRLGIACHLGLLLDLPTIGAAKSRLLGCHDPVPATRGSWVPLWQDGEMIGAVLRTRTGVTPLYVSCGHRVSLATAIAWVSRCTPRYRLPETTRQAHRLASGP